jgi:dihydrofolate synthase/folylpolyglutamate synthase
MGQRPTIILDGAHNPDKIKSTCESLEKFQYKKLILIFALNDNKDGKKIAKMVAPMANKVFITRHLYGNRACIDLKLLYTLFLELNKKIKAEIAVDPWQALSKAMKEAKKYDLILITGSFFLAGELRKKWISEEKILRDNS